MTNLTPAQAREAWVTALRSGQYEQLTGELVGTKDGAEAFCCLGVACEVAIENGVQIRRGNVAGYITPSGSEDEEDYHEISELPNPVREWLGLDSASGELVDTIPHPGNDDSDADIYLQPAGSLIDCNDDFNYDFNQIADLVTRGLVRTTDRPTDGP